MTILYITSDYSGVHKSLVESIRDAGNKVIVYIPLNSSLAYRRNEKYEYKDIQFHVSAIQTKTDKFLYKRRIKRLLNDIYCNQGINWNEISMIHAATTCVEGAIAYELHKLTRIDYICAIRNTDINSYFKIFLWQKKYFLKILSNSSRIILLSKAYYHRILDFANKSILSRISIIPNGINSVFLGNNPKTKELPFNGEISIVYVGEFSKNKNLITLIKACNDLNTQGYNIRLSLIGKGKRDDKKVLEKINSYQNEFLWLNVYEKKTPTEIIEFYRNSHIFAMVSHKETFGLVYIEALSQNLPIIYSKNEGIDGTFEDGLIGKAANSRNCNEISSAIKFVIDHYPVLQQNIKNLQLSQFSWLHVANQYSQLYH